MRGTLHIAYSIRDLTVHAHGCRASYSPLLGGVITIACGNGHLELAVLEGIERGIPATAPASYPCGPSGLLGEILGRRPQPCGERRVKGILEAHCLDPDTCRALARAALEGGARLLKFTKKGDHYMLRATYKAGTINLKVIEELNSDTLKAAITNPLKIPPLLPSQPKRRHPPQQQGRPHSRATSKGHYARGG